MLTVNRMGICGPKPTSPLINREDHSILATLSAEIAERLEEMEECRPYASMQLLRKLSRISEQTMPIYRAVLNRLHGGSAPMESFSDQAQRRGVIEKQTVHDEWNKAVKSIAKINPVLAEYLTDMRIQAQAHEDPTSKADALRSVAEA